MIPLITVEGPTASGKTDLAIALAQAMGSQIISADSRQVYRKLDIGTAKPSPEQLAAVSHHLIDIRNPGESYDAGSFAKDAAQLVESLYEKGLIPIVCGGTGLYVRALLDGLCELPAIDSGIRHALKARLTEDGLGVMYNELEAVDPEFARSISVNDPQRILRGLEVFLATGIPLSTHWERQNRQGRYHSFRISIDPSRKTLYERIDRRVDKMFAAGLAEEVQNLLEEGWSWTDPGMNTMGYKEIQAFYQGDSTLPQVTALIAQHTRNYAKRQCTWYRKQKFDLTLDSGTFNISEVLDTMYASGKL